MENTNNAIEREYAWDDTIEREGSELLPEGDYDFEVTGFERARYEGGAKLPPCPMAIINIALRGNGTTGAIQHRLFLHSRCESLLSAFFIAIGQKKRGEPLRMNWGAVVGAKGRCKIGVRSWKNGNGEDRQSNEIKKFYEPVAGCKSTVGCKPNAGESSAPVQPAPVQGVFTPGKF